MIDEPHVAETRVQPAAVIHVTIPRSKIREVMGPGLAELRAAIAAQGIAATGPWFTHHHKMEADVFDFEIGVPVATLVSAAGRVQPGELPAARVARTVYHGGYEGLSDGWSALMAWIARQGYAPRADLWECYLTNPEANPDPSQWRTELNRPLVA